ncbi:MAG: DUF4367 domain-containing protein [Ruminococcus sp.]|nr:DUF4367 domain-containing protein [Ruminococcus sp.]
MADDLNEDLFDAVLQKAFCDYERAELSSLPDIEILAEAYPIPKKEEKFFKRLAKEKMYGKSLKRVYLERAAVVFVCLIMAFATALFSSPVVRAAVKDVIIEWFQMYTSFDFTAIKSKSNEQLNLKEVKIGYVPDGYELTDFYETSQGIRYQYQADSKEMMVVSIFKNDGKKFFLSNDDLNYEKTEINSYDAWIAYRDDVPSGTVIIIYDEFSVSVSGDFSKAELIKISENIK